MTTCPKCGSDLGATAAGDNIEREILIRVPERHFPLMRKTFREMEMKLGMYGYGELANSLKPYGALFQDDWERLRYFDDGALAMAMIGITQGMPAKTRRSPGNNDRFIVDIEFTFPDGEIREIRVAGNATGEAADWFEAYLAGICERLAPGPGQS